MNKNSRKLNSIKIEQAIKKTNTQWVDVRSPREYEKGHFTNAINLPIFNNKQFSNLGIVYKNEGQDKAIELGQEYASSRSSAIINKLSELRNKDIILYCARGGMRSEGMHILLNNRGFNVSRIHRGYKSIREHMLSSFKMQKKLIILGGNTGSGKTTILNKMKSKGLSIIDLEKIANHRGSTFGNLGLSKQVTQQQFENNLAFEWVNTPNQDYTYIESESRKIGRVVIPSEVWKNMSKSKYIKIDMGIERRVKNLLKEYGSPDKIILREKVDNIEKRLGGQNAKIAKEQLDKNDLPKFCKLLLENYYDKLYKRSFNKRSTQREVIKIDTESNDEIINKIIKATNG